MEYILSSVVPQRERKESYVTTKCWLDKKYFPIGITHEMGAENFTNDVRGVWN